MSWGVWVRHARLYDHIKFFYRHKLQQDWKLSRDYNENIPVKKTHIRFRAAVMESHGCRPDQPMQNGT